MIELRTTRCPHCRTIFRVTASQLGARGGRVRCGRCRQIFDAAQFLLPVEQSAAAEVEPVTPPAADGGHATAASTDAAPFTAASTDASAAAPNASDVAPLTATRSAASPTETIARPVTGGASVSWEHRGEGSRRWLWIAFVPLLALVLAAQAAYQLRHLLAAWVPGLRPALVAGCQWIGCRIEPPRARDRLSIEASELQADAAHRGLLVLTATLRNRADVAVAYPYLELTLTDLQQQAVARRAFAPVEYAGGTAQVEAGIPANGEIALKLFIDASATQQQGYRLYLFYP